MTKNHRLLRSRRVIQANMTRCLIYAVKRNIYWIRAARSDILRAGPSITRFVYPNRHVVGLRGLVHDIDLAGAVQQALEPVHVSVWMGPSAAGP
jgi:hypothetical protein